MKRVVRHLFMLGSVGWIVLLVGMIWLWVRSYQGPDLVVWQSRSGELFQVISGHGTVDFLVIPRWPQMEQTRHDRWDPYVYYGTRYSKRILGFGTDVIWPEYGGRYVNVPHWFFVIGFAGMGLLFARAWWKRRPRKAGRCAACGYDMRATPERCPECGAVAGKITGGTSVVP